MSTSRNRTTVYGSVEGSWKKGTTSGINRISPIHTDACGDVIGNYPNPNPFSISKKTQGYCILDGSNGGSGLGLREFDQCPVLCSTRENTFPVAESNLDLATKARARTNPGRAHVSVPVFIAEMRDFPQLIKIAGRTILGTAGKSYLSWQFGWKPLIDDLGKMLDFTAAVEKRKRDLRKLHEKGGLRAKYSMSPKGTSVSSSGTNEWLESSVAIVRANWQCTSVRRRWAVVRWLPSMDPSILKDEEAFTRYARDRVLGLSKHQITSNIWEALPWSWLVDWFTNIGDYLVASDNSVAHVAGSATCIMEHIVHETTRQVYDAPPWVTATMGVNAKRETKSRAVQVGLSPLSTSIPMLDAGKFAILAALYASRRDAYSQYRT